jgi:hypothetical protein
MGPVAFVSLPGDEQSKEPSDTISAGVCSSTHDCKGRGREFEVSKAVIFRRSATLAADAGGFVQWLILFPT